jgi:3-oxoacyl-(acyl-carrier-protein) synthase
VQCTVDTVLAHAASRALAQVDVALSNSFGFGGHNSCILFSGFKP